ncbi:general substrate transporter [Phyllosticta capitalensis]|uniref:General substrate transporter n=2 Tax=Phyllosticta capitalensis TaxID=121624 RepID=A0ABR1YFV2_9PEZI
MSSSPDDKAFTSAELGKNQTEHIDHVDSHGSDASQDAVAAFGYSPQEQRKLIHRIDRRLVVTVGVMYCISLMDRTNLSAANIAGMSVELDMVKGYRYSLVTLVFFITYVVFQPLSTGLVRKIGPRLHLAAITVFWGATMIGMGFAPTWNALAGLRALLGIFEAGFFPSAVYLLSTWYVRYDMGKRYSVFYIIGCVASACAGILAYGLMQMDGLANLSGWKWIFIIEGVLTCVVGFVGYFALVGFPDSKHKSWRFLTERETAFIIARVNADRGDAKTEPFTARKFFGAGLDLKIWGYALVFFGTTTITYALAYFLPIILHENMGFSIGASQCLVAPPYVFAALIIYADGYAGDRWKLRGPVILFNMVICLIGLPIMGFHKNSGVRYFGVFLVTAGANANVPATMSYQANNIRGQWKRAFCSATLVGFGGVGGIAGSLVFRTQDAPEYRPGIYACIACALMNMLVVLVLGGFFRVANRRAARGEIVLEDSDNEGDRGFRYTY